VGRNLAILGLYDTDDIELVFDGKNESK
jgi:hypothetical protein